MFVFLAYVSQICYFMCEKQRKITQMGHGSNSFYIHIRPRSEQPCGLDMNSMLLSLCCTYIISHGAVQPGAETKKLLARGYPYSTRGGLAASIIPSIFCISMATAPTGTDAARESPKSMKGSECNRGFTPPAPLYSTTLAEARHRGPL